MGATPTRTLNPLPFNDLEPHRFEDLVRQLAYDFRNWRSLEAIGRTGSDEGLDIRAHEIVPLSDGDFDDDEEPTAFSDYLWVFQCKREKTLAPKRVRKVIADSLISLEAPPYGFVLAIASDVSKKTRDTFRAEMVNRGIEQFFIWAKGELEDLLFQPKNDHLLFAYFGISLQPRRRSLSTVIRGEVAKKKQLAKIIGDADPDEGKLVLLRDPADERYPQQPKDDEAPARWCLCRALHLRNPKHLVVLLSKHFAAFSDDGLSWDAILDYDLLRSRNDGELRAAEAWDLVSEDGDDGSAHWFWTEYISELDRAYLLRCAAVPLDRIIAFDPDGDGPFPVPQIYVDFLGAGNPFTRKRDFLRSTAQYSQNSITATSEDNRKQIFPVPLPSANSPAPAAFDDTAHEALPLSNEISAQLEWLFSTASEGANTSVHETDANDTSDDRQALNEFCQWREDIARPVFSSFVYKLCEAGHRARVIDKTRGSTASVELRVQLKPVRYLPGSVKISALEHPLNSWQLEISPKKKQSEYASRSLSEGQRPVKGATSHQLEAYVLEMLDRLRKEARP